MMVDCWMSEHWVILMYGSVTTFKLDHFATHHNTFHDAREDMLYVWTFEKSGRNVLRKVIWNVTFIDDGHCRKKWWESVICVCAAHTEGDQPPTHFFPYIRLGTNFSFQQCLPLLAILLLFYQSILNLIHLSSS